MAKDAIFEGVKGYVPNDSIKGVPYGAGQYNNTTPSQGKGVAQGAVSVVVQSVGGSGKKIEVDVNELQGFANEINSILESLGKACAEAEKIAGLDFYRHGQANDAVKSLQDVSIKYSTIVEHYARLSALLMITAEEMSNTDNHSAAGFRE